MLLIYPLRMGHDDHDISEAFSKYDQDGNQILDCEEQEKMKRELEEKRVWNLFSPYIVFFLKMFVFLLMCFTVTMFEWKMYTYFYQNALNVELHNLTQGNKAEGNEKKTSDSVDQEQFQM